MKKTDIGDRYISQLQMAPPSQSKGLYMQFSLKFGETIGRGMLTSLYRKLRESEENPIYLQEFYEMKNQQLDKALLFNAGYQADNYRQVCNWVVENHDLFGKEILDAGCECGIMSCFLAMAFPEAHITAVDRCENAITAGKELAERLEVSNITFLSADLFDLQGKRFDTVFGMRLLQENCDITSVYSGYDLLRTEADRFQQNIRPFAQLMANLVKEDGYLISIERCDVDPILLGWMEALNHCDVSPVPECYRELTCKEMEHQGRFQIYAAEKKGMADSLEVYRLWCAFLLLRPMEAENGQYTGWRADMELQNFAENLLDGFLLEDQNGNPLLTYSLWTDCEDENTLYLYQAMGDEHILSHYSMDAREDLIDQIHQMREEYVQQGTVARKLLYENGILGTI